MNSLQQHRGFTLIELIVVLVLIGVLAVSIVPRFFDASGTSEYLYRDQALNILRRAQIQAMQCTNCTIQGVSVTSDRMYVGSDTCLNDATHLCIEPRYQNSIKITRNGFNSQLNFDSNGRPRNGPADITIHGTVALKICIEAEGYIHPC